MATKNRKNNVNSISKDARPLSLSAGTGNKIFIYTTIGTRLFTEFFSSIPSVNLSFSKECNNGFHFTPKCPMLTKGLFVQLATARTKTMLTCSCGQREERRNCLHAFRCNHFLNRKSGGLPALDQNFRVSQRERNLTSVSTIKNRTRDPLEEYPP